MPTERREVQRQHIWRPGHDPNDPDAEEGSGYEYLTLRPAPADTRDKLDKYKKGGGPESGLPCMHCGETLRIVDEVSALDILDQAMVVDGQSANLDFTPEQRTSYRKERVAILLCSKCEAITHMRADVVATIRNRWLLRQK